MTSMPWVHAPIAHQQAFHAMMGSNFSSPIPPTAGFNGPATGNSPIHEKVTPKRIGTQVHSAVKSPGLSGAGGAPPTPAGSASPAMGLSGV